MDAGLVQFILEQLCNIICPTKPEPAYMMVLNKAHTQEEFIRGSMTKNPYSSLEIGPLMRDVKNKICHQLELLGLLEDDYGMELLVAGNIISLDLSVAQVLIELPFVFVSLSLVILCLVHCCLLFHEDRAKISRKLDFILT